MNSRAYRLYVHDRRPRWLAAFLGILALVVVALYFAAPNVPKLPAVPLFVLLAFLVFASHRASQSWIEVSPDGQTISAIPSWYGRSLAGESTISLAVSRPAELLFCRNVAYGSFDGYSAVLRCQGGAEQTLWKGMRGMDFQRCRVFSQEIQIRFGLPVRLLSRRMTDRGIEEAEWTSSTGRIDRKAVGFGLAMFLLPWLGILVRALTANPASLLASGILLCVFGAASMWLLRRLGSQGDRKSGLAVAIIVWALEFAPLYLVIVLVTGSLLKR